MDIVGQHDATRKAGFDTILSFLVLLRPSEVCRATYADVEYAFLGYDSASGDVSSLASSPVAKRQRSSSEALVSVPARNVVWLPDLAYASMESYDTDCRAANDEVTDVFAAV